MGTEVREPLSGVVPGATHPPPQRKERSHLHDLLALPPPAIHVALCATCLQLLSASRTLPPPASVIRLRLRGLRGSWAISSAHPVPSSAPPAPARAESCWSFGLARLPSPERHRGAREPSPRRGAGTEVRGGRCKAHTGAGRRCGAHALSRAGHKLALVTSALVRARHVLGTAGWALLREEATTMVFQRSAPCPQQQRLGSSVERRPGAQ